MIAYLEGELLHLDSNFFILKTVTGVGYQVYVPQPFLVAKNIGNPIAVYIYSHVREDEFTLYGFPSLVEKRLFELLIKTSGVGPKSAIAILSHLSPSQLIDAVYQEDMGALTAIPGIGKKTATKLCLDMRDHLKKYPNLEALKGTTVVEANLGQTQNELISALTNMGFAEREILGIVRKVRDEGTFERQLKKALTLLSSMR